MLRPVKPCVFFDRDGIINVPSSTGPYLLEVEAFVLCPGIVAAMRVVRDTGFAITVVTNQKCIGKGLLTEPTLNKIHDRMCQLLAEGGLKVLDVVWSGDLADDAPRRKPQPGMLLELAEKHSLDLPSSWMIGDQPRDVEAGRAAGCAHTVLVSRHLSSPQADYCVADVDELACFFKEHLQSP